MTPITLCTEGTETSFCHLLEGHSGGCHWSRRSPHNHLTATPKPRGACNGCDDMLVST